MRRSRQGVISSIHGGRRCEFAPAEGRGVMTRLFTARPSSAAVRDEHFDRPDAPEPWRASSSGTTPSRDRGRSGNHTGRGRSVPSAMNNARDRLGTRDRANGRPADVDATPPCTGSTTNAAASTSGVERGNVAEVGRGGIGQQRAKRTERRSAGVETRPASCRDTSRGSRRSSATGRNAGGGALRVWCRCCTERDRQVTRHEFGQAFCGVHRHVRTWSCRRATSVRLAHGGKHADASGRREHAVAAGEVEVGFAVSIPDGGLGRVSTSSPTCA